MKLNYCTRCAAPLHKIKDTNYICDNNHPYWNNPKTCVAVIISSGEKILCAKRANEPKKGQFDLPGGFLDYNESILEAAKREIKEETGLEIKNLEIIGSVNHEYIENISVCDVLVYAEIWRGKISPKDDVEELAWKPIEFLNSDKFAWDYTGYLEDVRKLMENDARIPGN